MLQRCGSAALALVLAFHAGCRSRGPEPRPPAGCYDACMDRCMSPYGMTDYGPCTASCGRCSQPPSFPSEPVDAAVSSPGPGLLPVADPGERDR